MATSKGWQFPVRARIALMYAALAVLLFGALGRTFALSVVDYDEYNSLRLRNSRNNTTILHERGRIFDRNGSVLAQTVFSGTSLYINARMVRDDERLSYATNLAAILGTDARALYERLYTRRNNAGLPLAWYLTSEQIIALRELMEQGKAPGLEFRQRVERIYPHGGDAAQVLGFVNRDDEGGAGIERIYDDYLKGKDGHQSVQVDAMRRAIPNGEEEYTPPEDGADVHLTLDATIQGFAEEALRHLVEDWAPEWCVAVILESNTGRILALANYPTFEPERFFEAKQDMLKIRAITDPFEPGSVFKPLILCGGIENDLFTPDTLIPYKPTVSVLGRVVTDGAHPIMAKDHASSGLVTATMGITKSSNTCANFVAQSIFAGKRLGGHEYGPANVVPYEGAGRLDVMLRSFGFGQYTGFDLGGTSGGESRGTLPDLAEWTKSTKPNYAIRNVVPSIAQGYQVQVTALQMLCCFNAIATGGVRMKPFVVDKVSARDGRVLFEQLPQVAGHSGISPETAAQMREMLENVVDDGTGQKAHIEGYRLAGKTGTATISTNGGYGENANTCSFVGFAPANDPRISAIVVARHPHKRKVNQYGYPLLPYGGSVAAPYLAEIVERTLVHLGVPRSKEDK